MIDLTQLIQKRKKKEADRPKEITEEDRINNLKHWTTFYRRNIPIYVKGRLGIRLECYQSLILWLISKSLVFVGICARGSAKSFLLGIFAVCMMLLYPHYQIVIVSSTVPQGLVIYNKIRNELCGGTTKMGLSPYLSYLYQQDLLHFRTSDTELAIDCKLNGSKIMVLPCLDSSRGHRANMIIYDEFRLLKKADVDSIFAPMEFRRQSDFLNLEEYANRSDMVEEAKSCYISSSYWANEWPNTLAKTTITHMLNNDSAQNNFFAADIYLPMQYNRITIPQYNKLKSQMSPIAFRMECLNEVIGEAANAFFTLEEIKANQILQHGLRRPTTMEYIGHKDIGNRVKKDNEYRIMFIDFAFSASTRSDSNDNTVIGILCCFWDGEKLIRNVEYIMTLEGGADPVKTIREMYHDFDVDYIVPDNRNGGEVYFKELSAPFLHPERGIEYHGFTISQEDDLQVSAKAKLEAMSDSVVDALAIPCVIPIHASEEFNSMMWMELKHSLQIGNIRFLIGEMEFDSARIGDKKWAKLDSNERMRIKLPHVQQDLLINEMISLEPIYSGGKVKLKEPRTGFKDRAVALGYGNYIATLLENKLQREYNEIDYDNLSDWTLIV